MKMIVLPVAILATIILVFTLVPDSVGIMAFSGLLFLKGEVWRLLTFTFAHANAAHLVENIASLVVASLLAYEAGLGVNEYLTAIGIAIVMVAAIDLFFFPSLVVVGASAAVFAIYGAFAMKGSYFVNRSWMIPLLGVTALAKYGTALATGSVTEGLAFQTLLHFTGFAAGICAMFIATSVTRMTRQRMLS